MMKTMLYTLLVSLISAPAFAAPAYPLESLLTRARFICLAEVTEFDGTNVILKVQSELRGEFTTSTLIFPVDTSLGKPEIGTRYFVFSQGHDRWGKPQDEIKLSQGMHGQGSYCGWLMLPIQKEEDVEIVRNVYSFKFRKPEEGVVPLTLAQAKQLVQQAKFTGQGEAELLPIPTAGWTADPGKYRSWSQTAEDGTVWQIADYNEDYEVDYVRYQVAPQSYDHHIWVDRDYDGFFDDYSNALGANGNHGLHVAVPKFALANARPNPAVDEAEPGKQVEQRTALWQALEKALPEEYRKIDVYAENPALTEVLFRSSRTTLKFSLATGKVEVVHHAKLLGKINRITYGDLGHGAFYALWLNARRELTISAGE